MRKGARNTLEKLFDDNWPIRRRLLFISLLWMAFNIEWLIWRGLDALSMQLATSFLLSGATLICSYVFGAVADDHFKRKTLRDVSGRWTSPTGHSRAPETPSDDEGERFADDPAPEAPGARDDETYRR